MFYFSPLFCFDKEEMFSYREFAKRLCIPQNSYLPIHLVKHNPAKNISVLKDASFHSDIKYLFSELIRFTVVVRKNIQWLILCFDLTSIQIQFYIIKRDRYLVIIHWVLTYLFKSIRVFRKSKVGVVRILVQI